MSIDILARKENDLPIDGNDSVFASFGTRISLDQLPDTGPNKHFKIARSSSGTYTERPLYYLGRAPFDPQVNGTYGLN